MKYLYFTAVILSFTTCRYSGHVENEQAYTNEIKCRLNTYKSIDFVTNPDTSPFSNCIQYVDSSNMLIILNSNENSLCFFDYFSKKEKKRIKYEKKGQDVGTIQGFLYHNSDSIFVYTYWGGFLYLTNFQGKTVNKYLLFDHSNRPKMWYPSPYIQTTSPISKINNHIIVNGFIAGEERPNGDNDRPVTVCLDLNTKVLTYLNQYPAQYLKYNWGGGMGYRLVYYTVNNDEEMVLSFAAEGLHIQVESDNEDYMSFHTYEFVKL